MIQEEKSYSCNCDNCGCRFRDYHTDFTLFLDQSSLSEAMDNNEWYSDGTDPDHHGKYYCPDCFKYHEEIDDKIILDLSRKDKHLSD